MHEERYLIVTRPDGILSMEKKSLELVPIGKDEFLSMRDMQRLIAQKQSLAYVKMPGSWTVGRKMTLAMVFDPDNRKMGGEENFFASKVLSRVQRRTVFGNAAIGEYRDGRIYGLEEYEMSWVMRRLI